MFFINVLVTCKLEIIYVRLSCAKTETLKNNDMNNDCFGLILVATDSAS